MPLWQARPFGLAQETLWAKQSEIDRFAKPTLRKPSRLGGKNPEEPKE
jgi:hypothetical protein